MRATPGRSLLLVSTKVVGLAAFLGACTATSTAPSPSPVAPGPFLLQFVGEYDAHAAGGLTQVALHVDGTFDATVAGNAMSGTFVSSGDPHEPSAILRDSDGHASSASFAATASRRGVPAQVTVAIAGALGTASLVSPWIAGGETMCDATAGKWTDDNPDPATGLYCRCDSAAIFLPSRGGCVDRAPVGDPPRRPLSAASRAAAGHYAGAGRVTSIALAAEGTFDAAIDGEDDRGTWWDGDIPGRIEVTSVKHAFSATYDHDSLTVNLYDPEKLTASR